MQNRHAAIDNKLGLQEAWSTLLDTNEYKARFAEPPSPRHKDDPKKADTRAGRALAYALDIRKFEIELYWKRGTYF